MNIKLYTPIEQTLQKQRLPASNLGSVEGEASGARHFVKRDRWEVISSPTLGYLKGSHLPTAEALKMLSFSDFYEDGTRIMIYSTVAPIEVWIKGNKAYLIGSTSLEVGRSVLSTKLLDENHPAQDVGKLPSNSLTASKKRVRIRK